MDLEVDMEKNIIKEIQYLMETIYIAKELVEQNLLKINQNLKVNIYLIKNGMEKDMMNMAMLYMN